MTSSASHISKLAKLIRYWSLVSTTKAGSGHMTSSLSAADLMATLFFGGFFKFDIKNPKNVNNDRLIFSKGHASPLFYALWAVTGAITEKEVLTLRQFTSRLEGHPSMRFPYSEAATGSLGQGLSIGAGMAMAAKHVDHLSYRTFVLLGDSEMAEGSVWEAIQGAAYYKLNNLIAILDVNRLGQRGETMYGHHIEAYKKRVAAFGWDVLMVDGHSVENIELAFREALESPKRPVMLIAKTIKGKGVSFLEDHDGWHGKALDAEQLGRALRELGSVDMQLRGELAKPARAVARKLSIRPKSLGTYTRRVVISTRRAYGDALVRIFPKNPRMVVLDGEVSNSTYSEIFKKAYPERFFEMFIAEQNMVGVAVGMARRGLVPFVSTFAAFFTRAFDQIRMARYSEANIKFVGSHAGVSIGQDGASQMGLEDIALFRTLLDSVVLYPSDAVSTQKLVEQAARHKGIVYIRTTRPEMPILYPQSQTFPIGGSKVLKQSRKDAVTVIAAGITVHEALKAHEQLLAQNIRVRVIDCYSVKPIDARTIRRAAQQTDDIIVVEDHYAEGGLADAVREVLENTLVRIHSLAVRKMPRSGNPEELLEYEGISMKSIIQKVMKIIEV
ncbi:MAG: transketolase [Candidatus Komeilibacteria bacterium]|nr:transketolase [Candidatus Komeilibacteria bacterium]